MQSTQLLAAEVGQPRSSPAPSSPPEGTNMLTRVFWGQGPHALLRHPGARRTGGGKSRELERGGKGRAALQILLRNFKGKPHALQGIRGRPCCEPEGAARCRQLVPASWINQWRRAARLLLQAAAGAGPDAARAKRRVPGDWSAGTTSARGWRTDRPTDAQGVTWGFFLALVLSKFCVAFRCWEGLRM